MKTTFAFIFSLFSLSIFAQNKEGKIIYKETIKFDLSKMEGLSELPEEMKANIPTEQSFKSMLLFTSKESLFSNYDEKNEKTAVDYKDPDKDIEIKIDMKMPEFKQYTNLKSSETVESKDLFGKIFLIAGKGADKPKWKISNEKKEILGYSCQKATFEGNEEEGTVEAWFSTAIPVSVGPRNYRHLPGVVLEVSMNGGQRSIVATQIELVKPEEGSIVKPTKGKKVSPDEFKKIAEEKQKEMMEMYGGKGNVIIQREER